MCSTVAIVPSNAVFRQCAFNIQDIYDYIAIATATYITTTAYCG